MSEVVRLFMNATRYQGWPVLALTLPLLLISPHDSWAQPLEFTGPPQLTINGNCLLRLAGPTGSVFQVQGSTNLVQWTSVAAVTNSVGQVEVLDTNAALFPRRFYRAAPPPPVVPASYAITIIDPPAGYYMVDPFWFGPSGGVTSDPGRVLGIADSQSGDAGFVWDKGQESVLPPPTGYLEGIPLSLSDTGVIVGDAYPYTSPMATLWSRNADGSFDVTDLNTLLPPDFGWLLTAALVISPDGRFITANATNTTGQSTSGTVILELDAAGGLVSATPMARASVSALRVDNGMLEMVGFTTNHPFLWQGPASPFSLESGEFFDLTPAQLPDDTHFSTVNFRKQMAGTYRSPDGRFRVAFWDEYGNMTDIFAGQSDYATDYAADYGAAAGINDAGFVVCNVSHTVPASAPYDTYVWHPGAEPQQLISLKSTNDTSGVSAFGLVSGINDAGQILVRAFRYGEVVCVLMTPE